MKVKAREKKGVVKVKLLIKHVMETGRRKGADGQLIPAFFIKELNVEYQDKVVLNVEIGATVSKDPYLAFSFKGKKGEKVKFTTIDSKGKEDSKEVVIK